MGPKLNYKHPVIESLTQDQLLRSTQFQDKGDGVPVGRGRGRGRGRGAKAAAKKGAKKGGGRGRGKGAKKGGGKGCGRGQGRGKGTSDLASEVVTPPKKNPAARMEDADCSAPKAERPAKMKPAAGRQGKAAAPEDPPNTAPKRKAAPKTASKSKAAPPKTPEKTRAETKKGSVNKKPKLAQDVPQESKEKAFARRWRPQGERASNEWMALRDVYDVHVRPHISKCPGKMEDISTATNLI